MTAAEWEQYGDASASHQAVTIDGKLYSEQGERKCYCPDDCNCHHAWRTNYCGCRGHDNPTHATIASDRAADLEATRLKGGLDTDSETE